MLALRGGGPDSALCRYALALRNSCLRIVNKFTDELGRRIQVGGSFARTGLPGAVTSATYDDANELLSWNGTALSYDLNGNMLGDGSNTFTWNARDQVATLNNVNVQYDAAGRRTRNSAGTSLLYDGSNATQELSGSTVTANIWTGGTDEFFQRTDSNGTVVPITDALGSVLALADGNGNLTTQYSYDPFGNTTASGGASGNPSQYTGREDEGTGLYFYRARYYSTALHRFINQDPLGFAAGVNFYAYVFNSPTNLKDSSGMGGGNPFPEPDALSGRALSGNMRPKGWWAKSAEQGRKDRSNECEAQARFQFESALLPGADSVLPVDRRIFPYEKGSFVGTATTHAAAEGLDQVGEAAASKLSSTADIWQYGGYLRGGPGSFSYISVSGGATGYASFLRGAGAVAKKGGTVVKVVEAAHAYKEGRDAYQVCMNYWYGTAGVHY